MDTLEKLVLLTEHIQLEPAEEQNLSTSNLPCQADLDRTPSPTHPGIFQAALPGGQHVPILKTLLTSACERNCYYCPFRAGRDMRRATFKPDEMANLFGEMYRRGYVRGLFLSSGIAGGGVRMQDQLISTAEILRKKQNFHGYLHLKLIPGTERDQVVRAMQLADRVSINLEAPNPARLQALAPTKNFFQELIEPLQWAEEIRRTQPADKSWNQRWPSLVSQFVVGAVGESDLELLTTSAQLINQFHLRRVYYSHFNPVTNTPLENHPPEDPVRSFRLYQASFLLRDYEFELEDMPFLTDGSLPRHQDPKLVWAEANLKQAPVEINRAERKELLRIPGIGPKTADLILSTRTRSPIKSISDLQNVGIPLKRALPFILLDGRQPAYQPTLW